MSAATATANLSTATIVMLDALNRPGAFQSVEWRSEVKPAAAHKTVALHKITSATVRTGIDYANLSVNDGAETGSLPYGQWAVFPYVITHKGNEYVRLYVTDGSVRSRYYVDGVEVSRDEFNGYLTESARKPSRPNGGTITVKAQSLTLL